MSVFLSIIYLLNNIYFRSFGSRSSSLIVKDHNECPRDCYLRENCSTCLNESGRCVWCESTNQCFGFSVYTTKYQFGLCKEWIDKKPSMDKDQIISECKDCSRHMNCSSCLKTLNCGWCYDERNPTIGICSQGSFSDSNEDCGKMLNVSSENMKWLYHKCPDIDECALNLDSCHINATCINTEGSYVCKCNKGFMGNGFDCEKTCYESCLYGHCSGFPDYQCICDLGWTGIDCSENCLCNNNSRCKKVGICEDCEKFTEGKYCERCVAGSYGNATSEIGCKPCECNGHGNTNFGICDSLTGDCFCTHNTLGIHCELCDRNYYGDPKDGGHCYFDCFPRSFLSESYGYFGHQYLHGPYDTVERNNTDCLWIVKPKHTFHNSESILIYLDIQSNPIACRDNSIFVYDGQIPDLSNAQSKQLLAIFCNNNNDRWFVESKTGYLSIYYSVPYDQPLQGFNAMYSIYSCSMGTCQDPFICDNGKCVCKTGLIGAQRCSVQMCRSNCNQHLNQGVCDMSYGRCICSPGYFGVDCSKNVKPTNLISTELFNTLKLSEKNEHLRKTLPRFGHSLAGKFLLRIIKKGHFKNKIE